MSSLKKPAPRGQGSRRDPLASLKMADIVASKPTLPAEIISCIVDYLAVSDLFNFARVSNRMREMVYDDARWVQRLRRMGCWNETEARRRRGDSLAKVHSPLLSGRRRQSTIDRDGVNGKGRPEHETGILPNGADDGFILHSTSVQRASSREEHTKAYGNTMDGFDAVTLSSPPNITASLRDPKENVLGILQRVKSVRGHAREEYGKVYKALSRFYLDALETSSLTGCLIFKSFTLPEQQAQMLSQIIRFGYSDFSPGASAREKHLNEIAHTFDTAALLEFRKGYEYKDIQGRMRQYAHVMYALNGGQTSVQLYLQDNRLLAQKASLGSATDCIDYSLGYGQLSLERTQALFDRLGDLYSQEIAIIYHVFPSPETVSILLLERVGREVLGPLLLSLFNEAHTRGTSSFLRIVSGTFAQSRHFIKDYASGHVPTEEMQNKAYRILASIFEPHMDLYLAEELGAFQQKADAEVDQWDKALSDQATSTEMFLMSNVNRQADKKDFMSSFKKVVMMPVNILPSFSGPSNNKTAAKSLIVSDADISSNAPSRSSTPLPVGIPYAATRSSTPSIPAEAPTTELSAKAAVMASKLENIRSLFSIEVALNLVHAAKSSLERAAQFLVLDGNIGEAARQQCTAIFILLLHSVGSRHVKAGFNKAIDHLAAYNPREAKSDSTMAGQVAPLATFLELVNVGDLIQQMLDVFYESELVRLGVSNRDDFLDPAVKEKKKFEAMLDERVAAGLGKGIDVLMDEVEFICGTMQLPSDFAPTSDAFDIGPTATARKIIHVVSTHTSMLTGSTDKTLLDVFTGEVGIRLFTALCKHLKRQRISTDGALPLLSDLSAYATYIASFKNNDLNSYFIALREVGQIYLIEGREANEMATIVADGERYGGVFTVEEVLEFAERRSDWLVVKSRVEKAMYGQGCIMM